jgi:hypothetical protein
MRATLHAGAKDCQHRGIVAGQESRRHGRGTARPDRRDVGGVHQRHRATGVFVENQDQTLV